MKITNEFEVPVPIDDAWRVLTDIERIVPCMPGAALTEVVDDTTYKGGVSIRLGPVALTFNGTAAFVEIDPDTYRALVKTEGSDARGRGGVTADVRFQLEPLGDSTRVNLETDLRLSGAVAQFGRGAGMIADVANHWVTAFADCLSRQLGQPAAGPQAGGGPDAPGAARADVEGAAQPVPVLGLGLKVIKNAVVRNVKKPFTDR